VKSPFVLEENTADGWIVLRSGRVTIMTCVTAVRGMKSPLGMAVAVGSRAENGAASVPNNRAQG
jgi:hypothetical protein